MNIISQVNINHILIKSVYFASFWAQYSLLGRGTPSAIKDNTSRLNPISESHLPSVSDATKTYERVYKGKLANERAFGIDPLSEHPYLQEKRNIEFTRLFNLRQILGNCVNERPECFQHAILSLINITARLYGTI